MSKVIYIIYCYHHLHDVLQSKEDGLFKLSSSALKVGVDGLSPRGVLEVVSHLYTYGSIPRKSTCAFYKTSSQTSLITPGHNNTRG